MLQGWVTGLLQLAQPSVAAQPGPVLWLQVSPSRRPHAAAHGAHTVAHDGAGAVDAVPQTDAVPQDGAGAAVDGAVAQLMHEVSVACEWVQVLKSPSSIGTYYGVKRDLLQFKKRPTTVSKVKAP
jgi:hypothetical protein